MSIFVLGLDLGQAQDYTAAVVIEATGTQVPAVYQAHTLGYSHPKVNVHEAAPLSRVEVRHIERFPLQTRYQDIASRTAQTLRTIPKPSFLAVDQTGVGRGVLEMLYACQPIGITITSGGEPTMGLMPREWRVPKRDLVSTMQVLSQNRQFGIARGCQHRDLLAREMQNFRAKISAGGHDTYEAWREADHDDLVLACAMACWVADQTFRLFAQNLAHAVMDSWAPPDYQISAI